MVDVPSIGCKGGCPKHQCHCRAITCFSGPNAFLSNFYPSAVSYKDIYYKTSEHAFQAQKAWTITEHDYVRNADTPGQAKRRGKEINRVDSWDDIKVEVMLGVLRAKFRPTRNDQPNPLAAWLMATGDQELIEGNTWGDVFWGQCPVGNGENMLGKLLMQVRGELRGRT